MYVNTRSDTSWLFGSANSKTNTSYGVSSLAGLVSDYNTIKNGSYGKLVNAYYKKLGDDAAATKSASATTTTKTSGNSYLDNLLGINQESESADSASKSSSTAGTATSSAKKAYSQIVSDAANVKSSISALSSSRTTDNLFKEKNLTTTDADGNETTTYGVDRDAISSAVNGFVDNYNALLKSAASDDATNTTVTSRASTLSKLAGSYRSQLSEIGISVDDKGALSVDKDKLAAADVNKIKSVFNDVGGFGDRADSAITMLKSGATTAASSASTYSASGSSSYNYNSVWSTQV